MQQTFTKAQHSILIEHEVPIQIEKAKADIILTNSVNHKNTRLWNHQVVLTS